MTSSRFTDDIINKLITIPTLTQILLMDSDINDLENLKRLSCLKALQELDFTNCPVAQVVNYRPILFDRYCPSDSASKVLKYSTSTTSTESLWPTRKKNPTNLSTTKTQKVAQKTMTTRKTRRKRAKKNLARKNDSLSL